MFLKYLVSILVAFCFLGIFLSIISISAVTIYSILKLFPMIHYGEITLSYNKIVNGKNTRIEKNYSLSPTSKIIWYMGCFLMITVFSYIIANSVYNLYSFFTMILI